MKSLGVGRAFSAVRSPALIFSYPVGQTRHLASIKLILIDKASPLNASLVEVMEQLSLTPFTLQNERKANICTHKRWIIECRPTNWFNSFNVRQLLRSIRFPTSNLARRERIFRIYHCQSVYHCTSCPTKKCFITVLFVYI